MAFIEVEINGVLTTIHDDNGQYGTVGVVRMSPNHTRVIITDAPIVSPDPPESEPEPEPGPTP